MKVTTSKPIIKCPHCGWEYLAGEILIPGEVEGKPKNIIRDALGKILYEEYDEDEEPTAIEHYICDHCDKPFIVETATTYKTKPETEELDFSNQYSSLLDD